MNGVAGLRASDLMSIVEDGLVLVGIGLDESANDCACELLGHAAVTDIIHVQAVCREIEPVASFTLEFTHRIEAVNQQDARLAGNVRNRSNDLLVMGILHQGFPVLGIDEHDVYSCRGEPGQGGLQAIPELGKIDVAEGVVGADLPDEKIRFGVLNFLPHAIGGTLRLFA
jgi:hypothetical protein